LSTLVAGVWFFASSSASFANETPLIQGDKTQEISAQDEAVVLAAIDTYGLTRDVAEAQWVGVSEFSSDCNQAIALDENIIDCSWNSDSETGFGSWVVGKVDTRLNEWLAGRHYSSRVQTSSSAQTRERVDSGVNLLSDHLSKMSKDFSFSITPDYANSSILISVGVSHVEALPEQPGRSNEAVTKDLRALVEAFSVDFGLPIELVFTTEEKSSSPTSVESYAGGLAMADFGCTAGFTVRDSLGRTGISTARHCVETGDSIAYAGNLYTSDWVLLDYASGDIAYAAVAGTPLASFQSNSGVFTSVTGYRNPAVGELVCHFGIASHQKCSKVAKTNGSARMTDPVLVNGVATYPLIGGLWFTNSYVSLPGDSGGPWFTGGTLAGVHTGKATLNGVPVSVFTRYGAINLLGAWAYGTT
jgi:hypothetical protein